MITDSLVSLLNSVSAITTLVDDRIYPITAEQDALLPHIILIKMPGTTNPSHDAASNLSATRFQINCYGLTDLQCDQIANEIRLALDGYKGTVLGVRIDRILRLDTGENFDDNDAECYGVATDYRVWHDES